MAGFAAGRYHGASERRQFGVPEEFAGVGFVGVARPEVSDGVASAVEAVAPPWFDAIQTSGRETS